MSETAFEKWWDGNHKGPKYAFENLPAGFKMTYEMTWNAAIDAALSECREVTEWDDQCHDGAKACEALIQKLRSE